MTSAEIKGIRHALEASAGRRLSCRDLGMALGLAEKNAGDTVRSWEDGSRDVTGPAALALELLVHCAENGQTDKVRAVFGRSRPDLESASVPTTHRPAAR